MENTSNLSLTLLHGEDIFDTDIIMENFKKIDDCAKEISQISELKKELSQISGKMLTEETDPTVPDWAKATEKPSYTAYEVGADPTGTAETKVTDHNTNTNAHNDIRELIAGLISKLNALADCDDETLDQVSEIVAYIKANRSLIESVTTSKVNATDIIDNLSTNVSSKPLSAAQGVALKALIDAITVPTKTSQLQNDSGFLTRHQDISGKVDKIEGKGLSTNDYDDTAKDKVDAIPDNPKYTDTVYDDTEIKSEVSELKSDLDKVSSACCDKIVTESENYNLLKPSECVYMYRQQNDSTELIASNEKNLVTGWIPVEYGKYYTFSRDAGNERVTNAENTTSALYNALRVQAKYDDGNVSIVGDSLKAPGSKTSDSTVYINDANIIAFRVQINIGVVSISTPELLEAQKVMCTSGDTLEESLNNAKTYDYISGDTVIEPKIEYVLKHDKTKADAKEVEDFKTDVREQFNEVKGDIDNLQDICCDKTIIVNKNYNLLKLSECTFQSKINQDCTIGSATNSCVTDFIKITPGKYYTVSHESNGVRITTTNQGSTEALLVRFILKKTDGSLECINRTDLIAGKPSQGTFGNFDDSVESIRVQITGIGVSQQKYLEHKPMLVEGDTVEQAVENALTLEYVDGDVEFPDEIAMSLKHDDSKADRRDVEKIKTDVEKFKTDVRENIQNIKVSPRYNNAFIPNERFLRSISNVRDTETSKEFEITISNNSGKTIKNASIVVGLHNTIGITPENNNAPFQIYDDVFSEPTGFKFYDGDTELPYYIESESDCNYIVDKNIKTDQKTMAVFSDGKIAVYDGQLKRMKISADDGLTWINICNNITDRPYRILLPDSHDNLFVASTDGRTLYKYTSSDGYMSGTPVIDMATVQDTVGTDVIIRVGSILAEDSDGNLYLGTYQTDWCCVVMKSSDRGDTWTVVFSTTECQHVHNIYVNKKVTPNEIFLGLDANEPRTYVSIDAGATWTQLDVPYKNREYAFRYAGENFYIGCGERNVLGGATLYKTSDYTDRSAYYPLFDNGQGIRDITNVVADNDNILIAGGCIGAPVNTEQLFLSEDKGETWKTVFMRPYDICSIPAGLGLRTFSWKGAQILSETSTGYAMRFVYGNGAKTTLVIVNVGDIPTTGKTITLKTGYVANIEQIETVLTRYESIEGKVADIVVCDGYVIDNVSNKRIMTDNTVKINKSIRIGQTSERKILDDHAYMLNGTVNLGKLSRLNFAKGFTVSLLFRREDGKNYLDDNTEHIIFQSGDIKLIMWHRSLRVVYGNTSIFGNKLFIDDAYLNSVNDDYVRITVYFTNDDLPKAVIYTDNNFEYSATCTDYPITQNFSVSDFIIGNGIGTPYTEIPNIARIEIYNRVLSHGEIMSLTNGCNLITDGSKFN